MRRERQEDLFDPERPDTEGLFDAQLPLPIPSILGPEPFRTIVKRDGRQESFAREKIARAIAMAGQAAGRENGEMAASLAAAVAIYLTKALGGQPPTADQVSDAVERVLLEMSQGETALAYARYRDRRARIRQLRDGDATALFRELEEARQERDALSGRQDRLLAIRTSTETLAQWDRERIVGALMRETGLEREKAAMIAVEVERQLKKAQIETLTTSLVRELVDAKLVEHGLGAFRERHRRLGVPLYDCERILRGETEESLAQDPAGTDQALAHAVKKEYALAQVFPPEVSDAHLRGDLHLHGLGLIDRLHAMIHSPAAVARFGIRLPEGVFAGPPRHPQTFLAQWVKSNALLQNLFGEPLGWDAVNFHFAPFLGAFEGSDLKQFAQMLVFEFAYRALTDGRAAHGTELHLYWAAPAHLRTQEAIGPGGSLTGKTYADYQFLAQQFALALMDVIIEGNVTGDALPGPVFVAHLDGASGEGPGWESFLGKVSQVAALRRVIHLDFGQGETGSCSEAVWAPRLLTLQQVTLNLPRAALMAGGVEPFFRKVGELVELAAHAFEHKRRLLELLTYQSGGGPLGLLALESGPQQPLINLDDAAGLIAVEGLHECVLALSGAGMDESPEALRLAGEILGRLGAFCRHVGRAKGRLFLTQNHSAGVSRRFAALDLQMFRSAATSLVGTDPDTQSLHYTTGARLRLDAAISPLARLTAGAQLQQTLACGGMTEITFAEREIPDDVVRELIRNARQSFCPGRVVVV